MTNVMYNQPMRRVNIFTGDLHVGSTSGICPPLVNLDEGGTYRANPLQRELWRYWLDAWRWVATKANGAEITVTFGGDMVETDSKDRSWQVVTRNTNTLLDMALQTIKPALDISARAYFLRGTEAHVGRSSVWDERLAADCDIAVKNGDVSSHWDLRRNVDGLHLFQAHHPPGGVNNLRLIANKVRDAYASYNEPPPDLAIFHHAHRLVDTGLTDSRPRVIICPSWQWHNAYSYRIGIYERPTIGLIYLETDGGRVIELAAKTYELKRQREYRE